MTKLYQLCPAARPPPHELYTNRLDTGNNRSIRIVPLPLRRCVVRRTLSPVSKGMGDRLQAGIPPWYVTKPTRSTQPCIFLGSLNRVPAFIGWVKGGNVASAGWQVTLCDPIWHVSSRSYIRLLTYFTFIFPVFSFSLNLLRTNKTVV